MSDKTRPDDKQPIPRRSFLVGAGTAVAASIAAIAPGEASRSIADFP